MQKKDSVIIYSGGLDSTTLLYEERNRIALAITFDYGSNHAEREIACARHHCLHLGIEQLVLPLDFMHRYFPSALTAGSAAIPDGDYDEQNMQQTVVPFRNGVMLSIACGIADGRGLQRVLIANHGGDHTLYPDCRPEFVQAMHEAMLRGTGGTVHLEAPYTHLSKADIVRRGSQLGIDYAQTYSCYRGGEQHCGSCATCRERQQAFRQAHLTDPTTYVLH